MRIEKEPEAACVLNLHVSDSTLLLQLLVCVSFPSVCPSSSRCLCVQSPHCSAAALCVGMRAYERVKAGCYIVVLAQLQPDIPAFPIQTTNCSYRLISVLLFFSSCTSV